MRDFISALAFVMVILLVGMYLFGCSTPEPVIVTKTVNVAVPTPCNPKLPDRPELMGKDALKAALAAAPSFDDQIKLLASQLLLYMSWVPPIEAGLQGCKGVPQSSGG